MNTIQVTISKKTLFIITVGILTLWGSYYIRDVLILLIICFILQAGLRPVVDSFQIRFRIPRGVTTIFLVLFSLLLTVFFVYLTSQLFLDQANNLIQNIPQLVQRSLQSINSIIPGDQIIIDQQTINSVMQNLQTQVQNFDAKSIFQLVTGSAENLSSIGNVGIRIVGGAVDFLFTAVIVLFASCYMIVRSSKIYDGIIPYISDTHQSRVKRTLDKVQMTVGNWFVGQLVLMLIIGVATFAIIMIPAILRIDGYTLHHFVLIIALIAALTEALPNIGPVIATVIIAFIALGTGASFGIIMYLIISMIILQQLEGIFIVPTVMRRVIDIDPVISIFGIVIGFNMLGVIGAIIALPIIGALKVVIYELRFGESIPIENPVKKQDKKKKSTQKAIASKVQSKKK